MNEHELAPLIPLASPPGARRGWRCPDEARLAAWVDGGLAAESRRAVEGHLADCAFCCGQVGFLARAREFGPAPAVPGQLLSLAQGDRPFLLFGLRPAFAMAVGTVLVLAVLAVPRTRQGSLPTVSSLARPGVTTSAGSTAQPLVRSGRIATDAPRIVRPSEGESIGKSALQLRWEEAPGALFYTAQLVDSKGDVVWEGRAETTRVAVPPGAAVTPGQPYFVWILAHLRSGATVRSPAVGFRLAPG